MNFEANEQRRVDLKALQAFIASQGPDQTISWVELEQATGVKMNNPGKDLCRLACHKEGRRWLALLGRGFQLDGPDNGLELIRKSGRKVDKAVNRAQGTTHVIVNNHLDAMTQDNQNKALAAQAQLSTLRLACRIRALPKKEKD